MYTEEHQAVAWYDPTDRERSQSRKMYHSTQHTVASGSLHQRPVLHLSARRPRSQTDGLGVACSCWMPASSGYLEVTLYVPPATLQLYKPLLTAILFHVYISKISLEL